MIPLIRWTRTSKPPLVMKEGDTMADTKKQDKTQRFQYGNTVIIVNEHFAENGPTLTEIIKRLIQREALGNN